MRRSMFLSTAPIITPLAQPADNKVAPRTKLKRLYAIFSMCGAATSSLRVKGTTAQT